MPKAARRESGPTATARTEPYPAIRPGDKPPLVGPTIEKIVKAPPKAAVKKPSADIKSSSTPTDDSKPSSFLDIKLPGEETDTVPIHDTCSIVRQKITALLGKDNKKPENGIPGQFLKDGTPKPYTKAAFVKELGVSTRVMDTFMKAKKVMGGAESGIYPPAYMFFERKRIFEGKKKTAGRLKCEEEFPNGLELRDPNNVRLLLRAGEDPRDFLNKYGQ